MRVKTCIDCESEKPPGDFYRHPKSVDGRMGRCKECHKACVTKNRKANIERYRAYDRARGNRMPPLYFDQRKKEYPKKYKANTLLNNAIRYGRIEKPLAILTAACKATEYSDD